MAEIYGTIGILPLEEWDAGTQYDLLNLVSYDGSSYVAHKRPPVGTLPTNADYWQISAQGAGKATAESLGVVKPDGTTTDVNAAGELGARKATQDTAGIVKGSPGIKVGADGSVDVDTAFTQATELANIIAGEAITAVLGKVSKAIATTMNLDQNALLKNMLTSQIVNDPNKIASMAALYSVQAACNANYEQLNADFTIPGTAWTLAQVNDTTSKRLKIGWINSNTAKSIGITDATDYMQVIHIPWSSAYPSQILLTASGKQRMYYRTCGNGTWEVPHLLTTKDDLYTRTSRDISNMTLDAVYALPPDWSTTIPVFVNYNSALAPDHNTCTGFISKNYVRLFSVSGKNFRAVSGQTDGFVEC